jgi:hypothetical protein
MEDVGIFSAILFLAIRFIWWPFDVFLVYFPRFGMLHQEKSGNRASNDSSAVTGW